MQVTFQECGCLAVPAEIVDALHLSAGATLEVTPVAGSRAFNVSVLVDGPSATSPTSGSACTLRPVSR